MFFTLKCFILIISLQEHRRIFVRHSLLLRRTDDLLHKTAARLTPKKYQLLYKHYPISLQSPVVADSSHILTTPPFSLPRLGLAVAPFRSAPLCPAFPLRYLLTRCTHSQTQPATRSVHKAFLAPGPSTYTAHINPLPDLLMFRILCHSSSVVIVVPGDISSFCDTHTFHTIGTCSSQLCNNEALPLTVVISNAPWYSTHRLRLTLAFLVN